ncbi:hypothetical protein ELE36_11305 [Pseudolysobacter antarcticus]|uniref:Prepilin-type N-terminal cleavage/methylation domain-containing protein n=1 Tax=Pseudolysobacter antarcticus TaxID=2511995 RepID=A0A411HQ88_9GAMM|nr:PilW family protein [Pseudolysobacter antarcticus]QBB72669.1 hypothetical protein ELE36_11305 [Pseudolysobacter antarcticus]
MRISVVSVKTKCNGFSLIEIMVGLFLGLIIVQGLLVLFSATSRAVGRQAVMTRLQENGRNALELITGDIRLSANMPCGSNVRPIVFTDSLAQHIPGLADSADPTSSQSAAIAYALPGKVFIRGNTCKSAGCAPEIDAIQDLPKAGLAVGNKVIGTDVLTLMHLQGNGWETNTEKLRQICDAKGKLDSIVMESKEKNSIIDVFKSSRIALLANCTAGEIFEVEFRHDTLKLSQGKFGLPNCLETQPELRLFDLDTKLQGTVFYLQIVADKNHPNEGIAALMRRSNGTIKEMVRGVERLDFRYSLYDAKGIAYWLSAGEVNQAKTQNGTQLLCKISSENTPKACDWSDISAVEVSMLVNTMEEQPSDSSSHQWEYQYSVDDDQIHSPGIAMPVTGLPGKNMSRREFRSVIALRH